MSSFILVGITFFSSSVMICTPKAVYSSVLLDATKKNAFERVRTLLNLGTSPDSATPNGVTPLMIASYNGYEVIAKLLLSHKARVDLFTSSNIEFNFGKLLSNKNSRTTALMIACFAGKINIVLALLKAGAPVNMQDSDGQTALIYAILGDSHWPHAPLNAVHKKIIELLLDYGANPLITDANGQDAAYYYSCVASLIPGFGGNYDQDKNAANSDPLYSRMK